LQILLNKLNAYYDYQYYQKHSIAQHFRIIFGLVSQPTGKYDAIIVAVNHREYANMTEAEFLNLANDKAVFCDVKGIFRNKIKTLKYWSL
jgi:UDP-N-acetyl-D-galactosamine dehydrogenase